MKYALSSLQESPCLHLTYRDKLEDEELPDGPPTGRGWAGSKMGGMAASLSASLKNLSQKLFLIYWILKISKTFERIYKVFTNFSNETKQKSIQKRFFCDCVKWEFCNFVKLYFANWVVNTRQKNKVNKVSITSTFIWLFIKFPFFFLLSPKAKLFLKLFPLKHIKILFAARTKINIS